MSQDDVEAILALPVDERGRRLATMPEGQWFERKSARVDGKSLAKALVGMANAEGGVVAVGLYGGQVEGVDSDQRHLNSLRQAAVTQVEPPVRHEVHEVSVMTESGRADHVLVFRVAPSPHAHRRADGESFLRVGDSTITLNHIMFQELMYDRSADSYEAQPAGVGLDALDSQSIDVLRQSIGATGDDVHVLRARNLLTPGGEVTIAALLLLGSRPQEVLPQAQVRVLRFREDEAGTGARQTMDADGDQRIEGPLPEMIRRAVAQVDDWAPKRRALRADGTFGSVDVIPRDVWIEAVVNAVVHRSYSMAGDHVRVLIFPHRIEVSSPGRFPGLADLTQLLTVARFARNPRIARVCADLGLTQELGEGIRRMVDDMRRAGLVDPVYRQSSVGVVVRLDAATALSEAQARSLPDGASEVVALLRSVGPLGTGDIADGLGASRPTTLRLLKRLRDEGIVSWVGRSPQDPRATWRIQGQ